LSALLARHRCRDIGAPKISLVNEVQCGTGTEWRGLIGQQFATAVDSPVSSIVSMLGTASGVADSVDPIDSAP